MAHREDIRAWLKDVSLNGLLVVDWGCGTKPIKNYLKGGSEYLGIDKLSHVGADLIVNFNSPVTLEKKYDVAFCLEVLEHCQYPAVVLENIYQSLRAGGKLYLSVPFLYPVHSDEDYWRFTDQGLVFLLRNAGFRDVRIKPTENTAGWLVEAVKP